MPIAAQKSYKLGNLLELLREAKTIQKSLTSKKPSTNIAEISKRFSQEVKNGNINSAMKILTENVKNDIWLSTGQTLNQHLKKYC